MPIEIPKRENKMPFNVDQFSSDIESMCKDEDFVYAFLLAVPDKETQIKYFENSTNYYCGKTYDPNYVLFFRRTLPSNLPKPEERWTNTYNVVRM
jgi:hypothetical protein